MSTQLLACVVFGLEPWRDLSDDRALDFDFYELELHQVVTHCSSSERDLPLRANVGPHNAKCSEATM